MKKIISILVAGLLILSISGCNADKNNLSKSFDKKAKNSDFDGKIIAENSSLRLEWDETTKGVILTDIKSGLQWGTTPTDELGEKFDEFGMPIKKHPTVNSVLSVSYLDYETNTVISTNSYSGAVEDGRVRTANGDNSVLVEFYFDAPGFMIPVQFILKNNCLQIKINANNIQEGKNKVLKISVAPFICSAKNDLPGSYLFIPSGSGTLIKPTTVSQQGTAYSSQVYGEDSTIEKLTKVKETESVRLPVYGAKSREGKAMLAVINDADETSFIEATVGATAYGFSSCYASFQIRGYTGHQAKLFNGLKVDNVVYSKIKIKGNLSVNYYPLTGDNANYVGMAKAYSRNLFNKDADSSNEPVTLNITVAGGLMLTNSFFGIPYNKLYSTTTLKEAQNIVSDLYSHVNKPFNVILKGYGKTGVDVGAVGGGFVLGKALGSQKDLKTLQGACDKNGINLFMDFDIVRFNKSDNGFSAEWDICYNAGEKKAGQYYYNVAVKSQEADTLYYLLDPAKLSGAGEKLMKAGKKLDIKGISLETLTSMSYSNYSDKSSPLYYSKSGIDKTICDILKQAKKNKNKIAASAANAYAAALSDIVVNAPTASDKEQIFDEDIPFYEMVFSGKVPLFTESLNLASDSDNLVLKAVESGCGLNYTVINNWGNELVSTNHSFFYNSVYSDIKDRIVKDMKRLAFYYEAVNGANIKSHEILSENVRKTEFGNGTAVYVNYGDKAVATPAGEVKANDFLVIKGSLS